MEGRPPGRPIYLGVSTACELANLVQANLPQPIPMKNLHLLCAALTSLAMLSSAVAKPKTSEASDSPSLKNNPFASESSLPYHLPPFDKIKNGDFMPAIEAGMAEQLKEIKATATDSQEATFDNPIVASERSGTLLDRAQRTFANPNACNTNPEMQK